MVKGVQYVYTGTCIIVLSDFLVLGFPLCFCAFFLLLRGVRTLLQISFLVVLT